MSLLKWGIVGSGFWLDHKPFFFRLIILGTHVWKIPMMVKLRFGEVK
jgi:hypothetical protein